MADILTEFSRLCLERDQAAYRVVGALEHAIYYCRRGETAYALQALTEAKAGYERADSELQNFKRIHAQHFNREETSVHGDRTAAA